jgi:hypothetical protein
MRNCGFKEKVKSGKAAFWAESVLNKRGAVQ